MKKTTTLFITTALLFVANLAHSQDSLFVRKMLDTLASSYFWGRGYTKDGMGKAATFLCNQYKTFGLLSMDKKEYRQPFSFAVNTFPGKMDVTINGIKLIPGKDFILSPESKGIKASGKLVQKDSVTFIDSKNRIIVKLEKKLTADLAHEVADYTSIEIDATRFKEIPSTINVEIENKLVKNFNADNICGYVKGTKYPDSLIIITAHYDHLGGLGSDTYFPGANDNASGVSLLLLLAQYYSSHPQTYSIGFICFAGEEPGLIGSKYFVEHPLIPLKNIRFLLNLDLEGTGEEGITVVNATEFPKEFASMQSINNKKHYLAAVNARGKAPNSDHYFFTEHGVPAFFFYTLGGIKAYHDVWDRPETLPLTKVNNLAAFIEEFTASLMY